VVAILPSLLFFIVAYDFEQSLQMKSNQLDLEHQIVERSERLSDEYSHIETGKYKDYLFGMRDLDLYSYHASIFETAIDPPGVQHLSGLKYLDDDIKSVLGSLTAHFTYNEVVAQNASLANDGSDLWSWEY